MDSPGDATLKHSSFIPLQPHYSSTQPANTVMHLSHIGTSLKIPMWYKLGSCNHNHPQTATPNSPFLWNIWPRYCFSCPNKWPASEVQAFNTTQPHTAHRWHESSGYHFTGNCWTIHCIAWTTQATLWTRQFHDNEKLEMAIFKWLQKYQSSTMTEFLNSYH